jgi:hypothetical protein
MDQHYFGHDTGLALYEGAPPSDTFSSSGESETLFDGETSVEDELFNKCGERGALEEVILRVDHLFDLDLDAVQKSDGWTAMHAAAANDNDEGVKFLIARGADKNKQDFDGHTPLHAAAANGHLGVSRLLCESGADFTLKTYDDELTDTNYDGLTPVQVALQNGHAQVASAILSYAGKTELAPSHGPAVPGDSVEDAGTWYWSSSCMDYVEEHTLADGTTYYLGSDGTLYDVETQEVWIPQGEQQQRQEAPTSNAFLESSFPAGWRTRPRSRPSKNPAYSARKVPNVCKIWVGGLNPRSTALSLTEYFCNFGEIADASVIKEASSRRSRCFGFVVFAEKIPYSLLYMDHVIDHRRCSVREYKHGLGGYGYGTVATEDTVAAASFVLQ